MSNKQNKRVKGKKISREFIIGSEAWQLSDAEKKDPKIQPGATSGWRIYVRPAPNGPCLTAWLKKVSFTLHETFPNAVRSVENVNPQTGGFELEETAYGGFPINVKLYFQPYSTEKWQQRTHYLVLDPYSGEEDPMKAEAEKEKMRRENMVRAEVVEIIEFNEPFEQLFDALTSENQFAYLKYKGKGAKGRQSISSGPLPDPDANIGEPPATAQKGQVWSKETENALVKLLDDAGKECDKQLESTLARQAELGEALNKLKAGQSVDEALRKLWESLPKKK